MTQQTVTLIASLIAAAVALINLWYSTRREKTIVLWKKDADRLSEVEELSGQLVEELGNYRAAEQVRERVAEPFDRLERLAGQLARYPKVRQAIRDLLNVLQRLYRERVDYDDDRETRKELEPALSLLLKECDEALRARRF